MKATETPILRFLQEPKQFFVPIFQRRYSWEEKHCKQLWEDVLRVGKDDKIKHHFLGSIVYMEQELPVIGAISRYLVIDGQQRLTTLSLLLSALSRSTNEEDSDIGITPKKLSNYYLFNEHEEGELRYKQLLTQGFFCYGGSFHIPWFFVQKKTSFYTNMPQIKGEKTRKIRKMTFLS